ncbi:MAG: hypothetical protein J5999_02385 [Oscillospiraceae bacterium]|nr:hypothetical protein [Oscillospiraceae bacterium]
MKMKKILTACAASVTALSMMAFSASAQGADDDSTVIDDTPVTEATEVITEAPVTEATTEAAPVAPVTNPTTGNAPVALAVIPVALAAAAVVAKKANK